MKLLAAFLIGVMSTILWVRPYASLEKVEVKENKPDSILKTAQVISRQACLMPGKLNAETMRLVLALIRIDSTRPYVIPDSSNTRIFRLNAWPVREETVLLETYAGNAVGSCGASIKVARYSESEDAWITLLDECGVVDTVLPISHNGIFDFVISDRWKQDHWAYRFTGDSIVQADFYYPLSDRELISFEFDYGKVYVEPSEIKLSYIRLGSDSMPYIIVQTGMSEIYLYTKNSYNQPVRINYFEGALQIDFLETLHKGMPDVCTFDTSYNYNFYEWDGSVYQLKRKERWVCPA